jgi:spastin
MLAAAVASESHATFFSISAATLVSKHLGEGERLVRALFAVARERAPSVIFIDEVDSIMGRRGGDEHEASRRLKTEFLIQFDGISSSSSSSADPAARVTVLAATNIPEELDEALIRRLSRRIYIPVPDAAARRALLHSLLSQASLVHELSAPQIERLVDATEGYSNSDLTALVSDAALAPLRALSPQQLLATPANKAPPVRLEHFQTALQRVRPSVSAERLQAYEAWSKKQEGAR